MSDNFKQSLIFQKEKGNPAVAAIALFPFKKRNSSGF
jgi:hypothetical protein